MNNNQSIEIPLDFEETLDFLKIGKGTLYMLTSKKLIPHYKSRKKLLFLKSQLVEWLLARPVKTLDQLDQESANRLL